MNASFGALQVLRGAAVHIDRVADGKVCPGNGGQHDIDLFCSEIMAKFLGGFLLQTGLNPHPEMARVSGSSKGCVRMVTVNVTGQPRPLHALWKIPSPDAMSDNFWQSGSMLAALELDTGRVLSCRRGTGPDTEEITTHPVSGVEIADLVLPNWDSVKTLAASARGLFPEFGVCGFDIAICEDGPRVVECSDNPFHTLYQLAMRHGIANPDLQPVWNAVSARQKDRLARQRAAKREAQKPKG